MTSSFEPASFVARDIDDLLNTLPSMFGFHPRESLVVVATTGPRCEVSFSMRFDLPEAASIDAAARCVAHHLMAHGADGAVVVALTHDQRLARDLIAAVERGLGPVEPIIVTRADGRRYWVDVPGFPEEGIEYDSSGHHRAVVSAIAAGQEILPSRDALVERFAEVAGERREEMVDAFARVEPGAQGWDVVERIEGNDPLDDDAVARFCVWVADPDVRDALVSGIDRSCAQTWLDGLTQCARLVVAPYGPAVLALTGFAAWMVGNGAVARIALDRALQEDGAYEFADVLLKLVEHGVSPRQWEQFRRPRAVS